MSGSTQKRTATIELFRPATWRKEIALVAQKFFRPEVIDVLKRIPGERMYSDTLEYLARAYARCGDHFSSETRDELIEVVLKPFGYFRSYHGCRPNSLESYLKDGLLMLTRERLAKLAFTVFDRAIPMDELLRRAEKADLETRLGHIYFCADAEALVSNCGHYLIYGSESLNCLWDQSESSDRPRFIECQERSKNIGIPTVFECKVPIELLPSNYRRELGSTLLTQYLQLVSNRPVQARDWSRNWGYSIRQDLPARLIRTHFHPSKIRDPLMGWDYHNLKTECAWCK